ncbi:MrpH family fimbial adhesin [Salmonella enterica]|uniref:MrpH family fimbial adhesin n=1 Tax=Salmonella enterica TaxID=28901 RepID=UPI0010E7D21B|nr:hypothetical protein [Salmonella enterica]EEA1562382.1 hypothetical protein [Salmonella enterica subsp. enterica serovar Africana]EHA9142377.1 hypothetical protein [Salmonella enterica subsp. enterica serovar Bochum]EBP1712727.1 hypothetical protein [Salmonella enterica]EDV1534530.1 hypothetical protein [Salmonella enterica subsp. enterica]EGS1534635.1 hypothetical protein [Salmonella enterica]
MLTNFCKHLSGWSNKEKCYHIVKFTLLVFFCFHSLNSFAYYYVQESKNPLYKWNLPSESVILIAGGPAQNLHILLNISGNYNTHKEFVTCIAGCSDGVLYYHPGIENDPWNMGVAITAPESITAFDRSGRAANFKINGDLYDGRNYIDEGGASGDVRSIYFTDGIAIHTSPWISYFQTSINPTYLWHNETYRGIISLTAPAGTPAGIYTYTGPLAYFNLQYCGTRCNPLFSQGKYWFSYTGSISISVFGTCNFSSGSLDINYGDIQPTDAQNNVRKTSVQLNCNSDTTSGTLKLVSTSGSYQSSTVGTSIKVKDGMDAIVTVNGKDASHGIHFKPDNLPIEIVSKLETYGVPPQPGYFQGSAVLSFNID